MRSRFPNWQNLPVVRLVSETTEHNFNVRHTNTALPIPTHTLLLLASHTTLSHQHLWPALSMWTTNLALVPRPRDRPRLVKITRTSIHSCVLIAWTHSFWAGVACPKMNVPVAGSGACAVDTCSTVNASLS